jgi:hypothetical protein
MGSKRHETIEISALGSPWRRRSPPIPIDLLEFSSAFGELPMFLPMFISLVTTSGAFEMPHEFQGDLRRARVHCKSFGWHPLLHLF